MTVLRFRGVRSGKVGSDKIETGITSRAGFGRGTASLLMLIGTLGMVAGCTSSGGSDLENAFDVSKREAQDKPTQQEITDLRAYCPKTVLRAGTETYRLYEKGTDREAADAKSKVRFQGTITEVVRECKRSAGMINIRVGTAGRVITGPKGAPGTYDMPIRVAVTRGDDVLYSTLHQVPGIIPPGRSNNNFSFVDGAISLPIPDKQNIIIYVGYDEGPPA